MENLFLIVEILSALTVIFTTVAAVFSWLKKISDGEKCQLRSHMLATYYKNIANREIRQFELENFLLMYKSYKALKGNSFVDKIKEEVIKWKVIY